MTIYKADTNKKMILQIMNILAKMTIDIADTNKKVILQIMNIWAIMTIDKAESNRKHCYFQIVNISGNNDNL